MPAGRQRYKTAPAKLMVSRAATKLQIFAGFADCSSAGSAMARLVAFDRRRRKKKVRCLALDRRQRNGL